MQPDFGISKKTSTRRHVAVAIIFLAGMLSGCGNNNSTAKQPTSDGDGNKAVLSNDAGTAGYPLATEQKTGTLQNNDPDSPHGATAARAGDGISSPLNARVEPSSVTSQSSAVSGVQNVSGPFGPFPPGSNTVGQQPTPNAAAPPSEPPQTPRGPFGPFPTSP